MMKRIVRNMYKSSQIMYVNNEIPTIQPSVVDSVSKKVEFPSLFSDGKTAGMNNSSTLKGKVEGSPDVHLVNNESSAEIIFEGVWKKLMTEMGRSMVFPKELVFLMGAPGSG